MIDTPLLGGSSSSASEERSPAGLAELEVEAGRLRLLGSALVQGLVHPDVLDASTDVSRGALANVLSTRALSTGNEEIGAVVESQLHVAPNRAVGDLLLVARSHLLDSAVRGDFLSGDSGGLGVELSSHGSVEAASLSSRVDNDGGSGGRSLSKSTSTHVELEEVSLGFCVEGDSKHLSSLANNVPDRPFLDLVISDTSEKVSPTGTAEFKGKSGRHFLCRNRFVGRLVHPDFLDITINLGSLAVGGVLSLGAFSTVDDRVGAVGESLSHVAPDGAVGHSFLIARSNFSQFTVLVASHGRDDGSLGVESTSHGTVEASALSDDDVDGGGWRGYDDHGLSSEATRAHMELEEISLLESVESNTVELGSASLNN